MSKVNSNSPDTSYKVYTRGGILKNSFKSEDLVDMRNVHFPFLQDIDNQNPQEIAVIQASRQNAGWTAKGATVCTCNGKCANNKCQRKRAGVPYSTKCHPTTAGPYQIKPRRTRSLHFLVFHSFTAVNVAMHSFLTLRS